MFSEVANWSTYIVVSKVYRILLVKNIFFKTKRRKKNSNFLKKMVLANVLVHPHLSCCSSVLKFICKVKSKHRHYNSQCNRVVILIIRPGNDLSDTRFAGKVQFCFVAALTSRLGVYERFHVYKIAEEGRCQIY